MKILFISDIHGITTNIPYLINLDNKEYFDKIVVLGDLYYTWHDDKDYNPERVSNYLESIANKLICLKGNCDTPYEMMNNTFQLRTLVTMQIDNINFYFNHGDTYSYSKHSIFEPNGVLVYGHEHRPYIKKDSSMVYICIGSISLPEYGSPTSYAIYDNKKITIYDFNERIIDEINLS